MNFATKPFYQVADRILGSQFLEDISEFFILFQTMYDGFVERARAVERLLHDRRTTFTVVSTLEPAPGQRGRVLHPGAGGEEVPPRRAGVEQGAAAYLLDAVACSAADDLVAGATRSAGVAAPSAAPIPRRSARVLVEIADSFQRFHVVAQREAEERAELAAVPEVVAAVPYFDSDIHDLAGLLRLGESLWN